MHISKIYRAQCWVFAMGVVALLVGLGSKTNVASGHGTGAFITLAYFASHLKEAGFWALAYWIALAIFQLSFVILIVLEAIRRRS